MAATPESQGSPVKSAPQSRRDVPEECGVVKKEKE